MSEMARQGIRLRAIIVSLALVALGCLALYVSVDTKEEEHPLRKSLLRELATIALIAGTLHVAYEVFQRKDYLTVLADSEEKVLRNLSALKEDVISKERLLPREAAAVILG